MLGRSIYRPIIATVILIAIALAVTVWTTRAAVLRAADAARHGDATAVERAIRADLVGLPSATRDDLAAILHDHADEGLRYISVDERGQGTVNAGVAAAPGAVETGANAHPQDVRDRLRVAGTLRRGDTSFVIEIEPIRANALLDAAGSDVEIGAVAATTLLAVGIVLIRREARRRETERTRERERRLAALGEMSAVIAHEIRNPLASLKGNAQLLAALLPATDKSRAKADRVVDDARRLEQLTDDLLRFIRTGSVELLAVDPAALLREAASSVSGEITLATTSAPPRWSLDGPKIREVMINLLDNAIAAGPPVRAELRVDSGRLILEVSDHGPGVADDQRQKIFEPFHTTKNRGTGLGLAITRRIVELHHGSITVTDAPGGGAIFRVELPSD